MLRRPYPIARPGKVLKPVRHDTGEYRPASFVPRNRAFMPAPTRHLPHPPHPDRRAIPPSEPDVHLSLCIQRSKGYSIVRRPAQREARTLARGLDRACGKVHARRSTRVG